MEEPRTSRLRLNKSESSSLGSSALQRQEVLLFHKTYEAQTIGLLKGWVSLPCSDFLIWESANEKEVRDRQKREFSLSQPADDWIRVELLNGRVAQSMVSPYNSKGISENCLLGLKSQSEILVLAYRNSSICLQWGTKLQECINHRASNGLKTNSLGNVYDISEIEGEGNWRDFKVTFVRGSWSCEEFMLFDSCQADLQRSAEEVMEALEGKLDEVNRRVMEDYISQLAEVEKSLRATKAAMPRMKQYTVRTIQNTANSKLMSLYKQIDQEAAEAKALAHYSAHHSGTLALLPSVFNLIYLQNAAQTLKLHQIAANRSNAPEMLRIRQRLTGSEQLSQQEQLQINQTAAHIARIKENSRNSTDPEVRSGAKDPRACGGKFFGEACDCKVF
jgi:hypothetical protein